MIVSRSWPNRRRAAIYQARTGIEVLGEVERFFAARVDADMHATHNPAGEADAADSAFFEDGALVCD